MVKFLAWRFDVIRFNVKFKTVVGALLILVMFSPALFAGQFRCGTSRSIDHTHIRVPNPPEFPLFLFAQDIRIEIADAPPEFNQNERNALRAAIEHELASDFNINNNNPNVVIRVTVTSYDRPTVREFKQDERVRNENVPVVYREAVGGQIRLRVQYEGGLNLDSDFRPEYSFGSIRETVSVNGVPCSVQKEERSLTKSLTSIASKATKLIGESDPCSSSTALGDTSEQALRNQMISGIATEFRGQYTQVVDIVEVPLACGEDLRRGNRLVQNIVATRDQWEHAYNEWQSLNMRRNEEDRIHNRGVKHEAIAFLYYFEHDLDSAIREFSIARDYLDQAIRLDPTERYFRDAFNRIIDLEQRLTRVRDQMEALDFFIESQIRDAEAMNRPEENDTGQERSFRTIVRARFTNQTNITDADQNEMITLGKVYQLDEALAKRVVTQERDRKIRISTNIDTYRNMFGSLLVDGVLTKANRNVLNELAQTLSLTVDDVETVESKFTFKDESVASAPAKKTTTQSSASPDKPAAKSAENKPAVTPKPAENKPANPKPKEATPAPGMAAPK
jgi:hypothetical protein